MESFDIHEILKLLPHRYPFLLVDRVITWEKDLHLVAYKNVTHNEPYFIGHFPKRPVMPGVLILEALAQATGLLAFKSVGRPPDEDSLYYFVGIDNARFKRPVEPGDQLYLKVEYVTRKRGIWKFNAEALVDEQIVCSANIMCAEREIQ